MGRFKLANLVLRRQDHLRDFPELLYRCTGAVDYSQEDGSLGFEGGLDLLTYFNAVSCGKWKRYADVTDMRLHLELAGDACDIVLVGVAEGDVSPSDAPAPGLNNPESAVKAHPTPVAIAEPVRFEGSSSYEAIDLSVPTEGMVLAGVILRSDGASAVRDGYWYTEVAAERVRPIKLALATTTFKKEAYVVPNIEAVREQVLESDEPIAQAFRMIVVDNGRTLDADALSHGGVTVIPNPNVGGSGGFARGMMEALASEEGFTHVLLMDDDVRISPESLIRTFNLLSLANERYANAFVNGAMLQMERPNMQFEDVSFVRSDGGYSRIKGNLFMGCLADVAVNEVLDVEVPQAYGAWWYSCIPLSAVREKGLPLPLFVRCDDVEYGMRCEPTYMTMNGICVWHEGFGGRFRASVDSYQYVRNYLVMSACDGKGNDDLFMMRTARHLRIYLRTMAYEAAELIVDALEDYLKGPSFLMESSGEAIMLAKGAKNERLVPLAEALAEARASSPALASALEGFEPDLAVLSEDEHVGTLLKLARTLPYDRHLLPGPCLRNRAATIFYGGSTGLAPEQAATTVLVACDRTGETAHVRTLDQDRHQGIRKRWRAALADYRSRKGELREAYRAAMPEMTSVAFWEGYLGRQ